MKIDDEERARKFRSAVVAVAGAALVVAIVSVLLPHRFGWMDVEIMSIAAAIGAVVYLGTIFLGKRLRSGG